MKSLSTLFCTISTKRDGSMKLFNNALKDVLIEKNRTKFFKKIKIDKNLIVSAKLVHGNNVQIVTQKQAGKFIAKTDGLITNEKNLFLVITVADCLPIFFYDSKKEIIALVHTGWRSLVKNILTNIIQKFKEDFKSNPKDIAVKIGPGISKCHFEVKNDVLNKFKDFAGAISKRGGKNYLDLKMIAKEQLLDLGIKENAIEMTPECTYCLKNKYFSYRRDKPENLETMIVIFGML